MRLIQGFTGEWSKTLKRYLITEKRTIEHEGPVAYAFGGSGGGGTEVIPTGPFGPQIPFIMALFDQAAQLFSEGPPQFPGFPTVAQPGTDLQNSQQNIADIVQGNAGTSQDAINTAATASTTGAQNPVSSVANPLSGDLTSGLLQLLQSGGNPLAAQAGQTLPGATGAINAATGGVQAPPPDVGVPNAPNLNLTGPGLNFDPTGLPQIDAAGININPTLEANLGGSGLNPFIEDTVAAATRGLTNNFQRNVIPAISDQGSAAGQPGGVRQGVAEGIAAGDLQQNVADVTAQLFAQGFDRNVGVQQNALGQIGQAQGQQAGFGLDAAQLGQQGDLGVGGLGLEAEGLGLQGGGLNLGIAQLGEQIRNSMLNQALTGAGLAQQGAQAGTELGQSGVSTGTSQVGNLLQAGNAQGLNQMFTALGLLPTLQSNALSQQGALNQSGLQQLGLDQSNIDAAVQRFFFDEFAPFNALTQFQNFIGGSFGSSVGGDPNNLNFQGLNTNLFPNAPPPGPGGGGIPPVGPPNGGGDVRLPPLIGQR